MSKKIIVTAFTLISALFVLLPWSLPDSWVYIKKGYSEYVRLWDIWATGATILLFFFAITGIVHIGETIGKWLDEHEKKKPTYNK